MALSIKTAEADRLARELSRVTGETMTEAVTVALRERLARERAAASRPKSAAEIEAKVAAIMDLAAKMRANMIDTTPPTKAEFDALWEDAPTETDELQARSARR
ncbi:MAG: type II toxin-antitoxin system VapB family antitoxin [Caulobacteraceae bacterium]|nr:type II toxin-antitoxin system VapB family antitoxin [Caulobacteraceae bacterium]